MPIRPALLAALASFAAASAFAAEASKVTALGGDSGWEAYEDDAPGGKICYLIGKPKRTEPASVKREIVHMSVTHRPADKVENVVNFVLGYRAKDGGDAAVDINGKQFVLFTDKDGAWTRDAASDAALVKALTKAKLITLKASPAKGANTTDHYDMTGFAAALALIDKACAVKR